MATYLLTGVAGFIAARVAAFLLAGGHTVVGVDNLNDAYDVRLKQWRLAQLEGKPGFEFHRLDICDRAALRELFNSQFAIRSSPPSSTWPRGPVCATRWRIPGCTLRRMSPAR